MKCVSVCVSDRIKFDWHGIHVTVADASFANF